MDKYIRELVEGNCEALRKSNKTLEDVFNIMFSRPEEIMAEWLEDGERRFMTFAEGEKRIRNAAYALSRKIARPGQFVALDMENSVDWIIAFWAILMSGSKPYLVNRRHPARLTQGIVSTLGITFAVAQGETNYPCIYIDVNELKCEGHDDFGRCGAARALEDPLKAVDKSAKEAAGGMSAEDAKQQYPAFADEIALATSATTLNEVICIYNGQRVANQILNCKSILLQNKLMPTFYHGALKQLAFLPFYHIFGLMAVYFWFAFFARPMVFMEDYSAESILGTVRKLEVTHIFAVPMLWHSIEKQVKAQVKAQGAKQEKKFYKGLAICTKIQNVCPGLGRKLSKRIMKQVTSQLFGDSPAFLISGGGYVKDSAMYMFNAMGYPLHNGYGMSETGITSVELRETMKARLQNSIGRPFDSVKYTIDDDGILHISGDSLCCRMIRNGREMIIEDTYNSGDVVTVDSEGNYYIKGRLGDRIIGESGENINPDDIEKDLELPLARDLCVFGYGRGSEEEIALVVRLGRDTSTADIKATADSAYEQSDKLPGTYKIRKFFFTFDPICAETAIKVSRSYLKRGIADGSIRLVPFDDVLEGRVSGREGVDSADTLGLKLRSIFAEFTERAEEEIYIDDHFLYDLGGTSIDYFSLVMRINEELNMHIVFDKEGACHTIREFERFIQASPMYRPDMLKQDDRQRG